MKPCSDNQDLIFLARDLLRKGGMKDEAISEHTRSIMNRLKCSAGSAVIYLALRDLSKHLQYKGTVINEVNEAVEQSRQT